MGCVYMATNRVNGKGYIGKTVKTLAQRRSDHLNATRETCSAFHAALKKYGRSAFTWTILFSSKSDRDLLEQEKAFIAKHGTVAPGGYNLTDGGRQASPTPETRERLSAASRRMWSNPARADLNRATREKMIAGLRAAHKRPGVRERMLEGMRKTLTPERSAKISAAVKLKYLDADYRSRRLAGIINAHSDPACRARHRAASLRLLGNAQWLERNRIAAERRRVQVECVDTGIVYASLKAAASASGLWDSNIAAVCRGRHRTTGGLRWRYVKDKIEVGR